jgi:acetyl-CoA C-acetyltransferase
MFLVADQDEFALESQNRAALAASKNLFDSQINPIEIKVKRDLVPFRKG